jgi:hypothetical protein
MLVKIDEHILTRTEGIGIIEAHFSWSNWCFEQLRGALSSTRILRFVLKCLPKIRLTLPVLSAVCMMTGGVGISFVSKTDILRLDFLWPILLIIIVNVSIFLVPKLFSFYLKRKIEQYL